MKKILKSTLVVFVLFITVISCSKDDPPTPPVEYEGAELVSRNYLTADISLNFLMDDVTVNSDLAYAFGGSGAFEWEVGASSVTFSIKEDDIGVLFSADLLVVKDRSYYSAVVGPYPGGVVVFGENDLTEPATGNVRIRFLHAYKGVDLVDLYIGGTTADHKKVTNLDFSDFSNYIEVSHADVSAMIICTEAGVLPDLATNLLTIEANTSHEADKIYLDALASETIDATSKFSLFVTEQ